MKLSKLLAKSAVILAALYTLPAFAWEWVPANEQELKLCPKVEEIIYRQYDDNSGHFITMNNGHIILDAYGPEGYGGASPRPRNIPAGVDEELLAVSPGAMFTKATVRHESDSNHYIKYIYCYYTYYTTKNPHSNPLEFYFWFSPSDGRQVD